MWRNRIVEAGVQRADQFVAHPDNWRIHPHTQEALLTEVLDKIGWVQDVIVSARSGYVIDGHLRVAAALHHGDETLVPYKTVDVTENEEATLLATYDPIAALAKTDHVKLDVLKALVPEDYSALLRTLHADRQTTQKLVAFTASPAFEIVVSCENETQQTELLQRLREEGFSCRTSA